MGESLKKMAEVLKAGATMLDKTCPQCYSPLFKLPSGEIYCAKCERRVVVVKSGEDALQAVLPVALYSLEETVSRKLRELEGQINSEKEPQGLQTLVSLALGYLEILQRIRKLRGPS
ncbi:MAG: Sjogren's syndrome/scleroderma autoantigen 1 family protein [Candidatus Bathyarchaeia archaeon]